jgi:hypothetical protein
LILTPVALVGLHLLVVAVLVPPSYDYRTNENPVAA